MDDTSFNKILKPFYMKRNVDESGISGTGIVVEGCIFPSKRIICKWNSEYSSIAIHSELSKFKACHMDFHMGMNDLVIFDSEVNVKDTPLKFRRFLINREYNPNFKNLTLGNIIYGIEFKGGKIAIEYTGKLDAISIYDSVSDLKQVVCKYETSKLIYLDY